MSLTNDHYFRRVYNFMDLIAEIGGLFTAFGSIFMLMTGALNYFGSYQFVMTELFYSSKKKGGKGG